MQAEMYEIVPCPVGRIAIMPRPRGDAWLMNELNSLKLRGVTDVVSLLQPMEEFQLGLRAEQELCELLQLGFHRHPVQDHGVPVRPAFDEFVSTLVPILEQQGFIAVHCMAGVGRSAVLAAALLCRFGVPPAEAIAAVSHARGFEVPETAEQVEFIHRLG
jgi:protein-tyrosine phosphatase